MPNRCWDNNLSYFGKDVCIVFFFLLDILHHFFLNDNKLYTIKRATLKQLCYLSIFRLLESKTFHLKNKKAQIMCYSCCFSFYLCSLWTQVFLFIGKSIKMGCLAPSCGGRGPSSGAAWVRKGQKYGWTGLCKVIYRTSHSNTIPVKAH